MCVLWCGVCGVCVCAVCDDWVVRVAWVVAAAISVVGCDVWLVLRVHCAGCVCVWWWRVWCVCVCCVCVCCVLLLLLLLLCVCVVSDVWAVGVVCV